jgi:hypothetical protein
MSVTDTRLGDSNKQAFCDFLWKMRHNIPDAAFRDLPYARRDIQGMRSWEATQAHVGQMSELGPKILDCCMISCMCYVGLKYKDL